jgi:hypothetical protein
MHILKPGSQVGAVALWDSTRSRPDLGDRDLFDLSRDLRRASKSGDVFWFEVMGDELEPLSLSIHAYVDEDCADCPEGKYRQRGGTFRLNVPSGRLVAGGVEYWSGHDEGERSSKTEIDIPPGSYALTAREYEFDTKQHDAEMVQLLGEKDWRFYNRMIWLRVVGCLPILACIVLALLRKWSVLLSYAVPIAACYWLVQAVFWRFGRWARIERAINDHQSKSLGIILELRKAEDPSLLKGGSVRIS